MTSKIVNYFKFINIYDQKNIRIFDVLISVIVLIIFSPLIIIISFLLFVLDGRPIIYKQIRVGYKGRKFIIFKFRTMKEVIIEDEQLRLTNLGKILRKSSLDELPQLINVLNRDMSLVGPRPLPEKIEKILKLLLRSKGGIFYLV